MSSTQDKLHKIIHALSEAEQVSLLDYAEFLSLQNRSAEDAETLAAESDSVADCLPLKEGTHKDETVIAAVKRLSNNYFMLDKDALLHKTSALMTAHILQGRRAEEVIRDLETLFENEYKNHKGQ